MAHSIQRIPDREIFIEGKPYLYFGGTAYLGLQNYAPFKTLYLKNVSEYGMHYGASRKSNIKLNIYEQAEQQLAEWVGSEGCLTMSSGYLAAQLTIQTLLEKGHPVIAAPHAHTALLMPGVEQTNNPQELVGLIDHKIEKNLCPTLLFDTIDFSGNQFPNFEILQRLPLDKIILIGDDSHGIGLVGDNGNGCYQMLKQLNPSNLLICCSLGKALGTQAGAVFGNKEIIEVLENSAFYGGASPASPAFIATLMGATEIYSERLEVLKSRYQLLKYELRNPSYFNHLDGHPTFEFQNEGLAHALHQDGFIFTNFHYPNKNGPLVSRLVLSAYHTDEDIKKLAESVNAHFN